MSTQLSNLIFVQYWEWFGWCWESSHSSYCIGWFVGSFIDARTHGTRWSEAGRSTSEYGYQCYSGMLARFCYIFLVILIFIFILAEIFFLSLSIKWFTRFHKTQCICYLSHLTRMFLDIFLAYTDTPQVHEVCFFVFWYSKYYIT